MPEKEKPFELRDDWSKPHLVFIGRWNPLHRGHIEIMRKRMEANPELPILVLVRATSYDRYSPLERAAMCRIWMQHEKIVGTVLIIPDIKGVYYGRGVGYEVEMVEVDEDIKGISATDIRSKIDAGDDSWKEMVAPGIEKMVEQLEEMLGERIQKVRGPEA